MALSLQFLQRSIARPGRDDHTALHTHVEGETQRLLRPVDSLLLGQERRRQQDERSHCHLMVGQEAHRSREVRERHALVEARQDVGVNGLQSHRHLECRP